MKIGIKGRVKCVKKSLDNEVLETYEFDNIVTDTGLNYMGTNNVAILAKCQIGSGNSTPNPNQSSLDALIASVSGSVISYDYDYNPDNPIYINSQTNLFKFTNLNNVNITEIGLMPNISGYNDIATRALIKDAMGNPTSITVLTGEVLEVYYTMAQVFSTEDSSFQINVYDKDGNAELYNVDVRLAYAGHAENMYNVGRELSPKSCYVFNDELKAVTSTNTGRFDTIDAKASDMSVYVPNSFKRIINAKATLSKANNASGIRRIMIGTTMGFWQFRFGRVSDDAPLQKSDQKVLEFPVEFNWGRYEPA